MPKRNLIWVVVVVAGALMTAWIIRPVPTTPRAGPARGDDVLMEAYHIIAENTYVPIDGDELRRYGIEGMVGRLDPYSRYIPPGKARAFRKRMMGRGHGLGLVTEDAGTERLVVYVHPGSPAAEADEDGVLAGDAIVAVNVKNHVPGRPTTAAGSAATRPMTPGPDGKVHLVVRRGGELHSFAIAPADFSVEAVMGLYRDREDRWVYLVDPDEGIAYLRVEEFVEGTVARFQQAFRSPSGVRGLVLDLRDNPGGLLPQAAALANLFIDSGPIVTVAGRGGSVERVVAHTDGTYPGIPVVVLVNGQTASAAEIVAGALALADRAVLVGQPTRGKHCIQGMFDLPGRLGLVNLTTKRFFFEADARDARRFQRYVVRAATRPHAGQPEADPMGTPIFPHVPVEISPEDRGKLRRLRWKAWTPRRPAPTTAPATRAAASAAQDIVDGLLLLDAPLTRAVQLLRNPRQIRRILAAAATKRAALWESPKAAPTRPHTEGAE